MKKRVLSMVIALLLMSAIVVQPTYAAGPVSSAENAFYQKLAKLLSEQDDSCYFDKIELQIGDNALTIDGEVQMLDVPPEIVNSRTMLPIRAVAEAAGATVDWVQETATVVIESAYGDEISCSIGSDSITVNSAESELDVTPYIKSGRTYLPLRAVSEALELNVEWDSATSKVTLTAPYQTARILALADHLDLDGLTPETVITDGTGMWVLQFTSPTEAKEAAEVLSKRGIVAEPDYYISPIDENMTYTQISQNSSHYSWGATDCGFDAFIDNNKQLFNNKGVVAVVDTGVEATHPFFRGRVQNGYNVFDGGNGTTTVSAHGTHVAGTIIDCVGDTPVSIMPIRVFDSEGATNLTVAAGIKYAADHGADVINLSLGGGHSDTEDAAVSYAISKGCVVVASAGNENASTAGHCPAHITVGGTLVVSSGDINHRKASTSNYGTSVDLMAPGVNIRAAVPGGGYATASGTSMAAPHVSAAAVLIDLAWGSELSPAEIETRVRTATTYGSWTNQTVGCGFLDMSKAETPDSAVTPKVSLTKRTLNMSVGSSEALGANITPNGTAISWTSNAPKVATVSNNGVVSAVGNGSATITATISVKGKTYSDTCTVTVNAASIRLSAHDLSMTVGEAQNLTATTTPNGQNVTWTSSNPTVATVSSTGRVLGIKDGTTTVVASMTYGGKSYTDSCKITVKNDKIRVEVTTESAKDVTQTEATLYGSVTSPDSSTRYDGCGMYLGTSKNNMTELGRDRGGSKTNTVNFWYSTKKYGVTLQPGTTYYYQAYVLIGSEYYWGEIKSFTTPKSPVTVTTKEAKSVTRTEATLYGYVTSSDSKTRYDGCGMYLGTSKDNMSELGRDRGSSKTNTVDFWYSTKKYGVTLQPGTTYYYQAYVLIGNDYYWGEIKSFTTQR